MDVKDISMVSETSEIQDKLKNKLVKSTILDSFTKLTSDVEKVRLSASIRLLKHLSQDSDKAESENSYALDRLIRGVGSSRTNAKTGFYTVLVSFLSNTSSISVDKVLEVVQKHLSTGGSNSKSENADICMGQILVCGALIHSEMFLKGTPEEQKKIIEILTKAGNKRSYLTLASYTFIVELLEKLDEETFKAVMWPVMKPEVSKPWKEQNMDTIYFLSEARTRFPSVVKSKFINRVLGTPEIVHEDSVKPLCELLLNIPMLAALKHPIYPIMGRKLAESTIIQEWCTEMDKQLMTPTRNKHLVITTLLTTMLEFNKDSSKIPEMLRNQYITVTLATFQNTRTKNKNDDFVNKTYMLFEALTKSLKKEDIESKVKISVLNKLLFYPGTFIFEKITKSKLIQHITTGLNADGVKKLAKVYREVVLASKPRVIGENRVETWINMDRTYATQLIIKLMGHPSVQKEVDWRMKQLKFILKLGFFKSDSEFVVGVELAVTLKECFYRALDLKLPKLEDLRNILSSLVHHINEEIFTNNNLEMLRTPLSEDGVEIWKNMFTLVETLEEKNKLKHSCAVPVFHTLVLHMGLQLLNDFEMAQNALKELHSCYGRLETKKHKTDVESEDTEPMWVEVVVDLFLSFLSQNSHLLRSVIGCVFPHLCPHLTITALHQILEVLDPKNDHNPLSKTNESSDDESDDGENDEEGSDDEESDGEESELSDLEEAENEEGHETATDKLRIAVRDALHKSGYQTDDESVDMDQMDEEEGQKLDDALAEAFKNVKKSKGKNSKQNKDERTLTHFRVRVLDLIEMYLVSETSMLHCLEIAIALLQILEFSIRDVHQKPLENRVRSCLKKLTAIKKFGTTEGVTETILIDMLNSFLDKGSKSAFIYQEMGNEISDCCIFIIKCSQLLPTETLTPKKSNKKLLQSPVVQIFTNSLSMFFNKRDCLLPFVLFKNMLQISWNGNWAIIPLLVQYSFDNGIRPFRRSQALDLLRIFYSNSRFRMVDLKTFKKKIDPIESELSENSINLLNILAANPAECKVREKFVCQLFNLLTAVKSANSSENVQWETIGNCIRKYRSHVTLARDAKIAYNKLCRILGISNIVKMQNNEQNGHAELSEDETKSETKSQEDEDNKKDKKRKKAKSLKQDKQKLKKEARLLRLKASSEGLTDEIIFSNISLTDIKMEEIKLEEEEETQTKKNQVNGVIKDSEKSFKKRHNSQSTADTPRKKKLKKEKLKEV